MEVVELGRDVLAEVLQGHIPSKELLSLFVSKMLGVGILAGACITKLPQIIAVVGSKSADGLSILAFEIENFMYMVHAAYGYTKRLPITAYGESGVVWLQNIVLLFFIYTYARSSVVRPLVSVALVLAMAYLAGRGVLDEKFVTWLYNMNLFVFLASRLPLIWTAFRQKRTGQLSLITSFVQFLGGVVRVFTSIREGCGVDMVRGFIVGATVNFVVVAQIVIYGKDGRAKKKAE